MWLVCDAGVGAMVVLFVEVVGCPCQFRSVLPLTLAVPTTSYLSSFVTWQQELQSAAYMEGEIGKVGSRIVGGGVRGRSLELGLQGHGQVTVMPGQTSHKPLRSGLEV